MISLILNHASFLTQNLLASLLNWESSLKFFRLNWELFDDSEVLMETAPGLRNATREKIWSVCYIVFSICIGNIQSKHSSSDLCRMDWVTGLYAQKPDFPLISARHRKWDEVGSAVTSILHEQVMHMFIQVEMGESVNKQCRCIWTSQEAHNGRFDLKFGHV